MNIKKRLDALKPADRKRKPPKMEQPESNGFRKAGVVLTWIWVLWITLVVVATQATSGTAESEVEKILAQQKENIAASTAGTEFAKTFAAEYFEWEPSSEGWEQRQERLAPYLANGLDEQAGTIVLKQEWSSVLESASVAAVKETGAQQAMVTLKVVQKLTKKEKEESFTEKNESYFTVPVGYEKGFGIYQLPSFTTVPESTELVRTKIEGEHVNGETIENVKNFLPTFFQSYSVDTPDKLAYFTNDPNALHGLEGTMVFEEIEEADVVGTATEKEYLVLATVILRDPETGSGYRSQYRLTVAEKDGRYIVLKLNEGVE